MFGTKFWPIFVLSGLLFGSTMAPRPRFRLYIDDFQIVPVLKELFLEVNCRTTNARYVNCNMMLSRNVHQIEAAATVDLIKAHNRTMRLVSFRLDACKFLTSIHNRPLLDGFAKSLVVAIHGNIKCPVLANFNYTLNNWTLSENIFSIYMPETQFKVLINLFENKILVCALAFKGRIKQAN